MHRINIQKDTKEYKKHGLIAVGRRKKLKEGKDKH
jgi:hypothetical protein